MTKKCCYKKCCPVLRKDTRPRQFGSGACETLFNPPHKYFHQCSGEKIHCPHVCHHTFRILNMRLKCFSENFSCLIVPFSAKSLSTSYAWFVYGLHSALTPRLSGFPASSDLITGPGCGPVVSELCHWSMVTIKENYKEY